MIASTYPSSIIFSSINGLALILTPSSQLLSSTFNCILDLFMQCFKLLKLLLPVFKYFSISEINNAFLTAYPLDL